MRLSVRVEVDMPLTPQLTDAELADKLAQIAAQALEQYGASVLHAASVKRKV